MAKLPNIRIRIAVTGSRGKSSVVRLLHAGFCACGINCRSRVTGVLPRELSRDGERAIIRASGAHVGEFAWWLAQLPSDTEAAVTENSAVAPELQRVCPELLKPTLTVLTNTRPDHTALWGGSEESALRALSGALPSSGVVVLPRSLAERCDMILLAREKNLKLVPVDEKPSGSYRELNIALAQRALELSGVDSKLARKAMEQLAPDIADSRLMRVGSAALAFAFSINDLASTQEYFNSLGWRSGETTFLFNHRNDRGDRLRAFEPWMRVGWGEVCIAGDRPFLSPFSKSYIRLADIGEFCEFIKSRRKIFGCGNTVYGLPLAFRLAHEGGLLS